MKFTKMHGLGNDFVMVKEIDLPEFVELDVLARSVCDRHFGIGADGLIIACPSQTSDIRMRIINSDGSEAEMCGNGIRCFAKYVFEEKMVMENSMTVETLAGEMIPVLQWVDEEMQGISVDMNEPHFLSKEIPVNLDVDIVLNHPFDLDGRSVEITCVSMGNPHCIVYVDDIDSIPLSQWGPFIENHSIFPHKTNVEFVEVVNDSTLKMRVWERGAAETLACGTGACATLVASVLTKQSKREATVMLAGGNLHIYWDEHDNHVYMTGPATNVFTGDYII